MLPRVTFWVEGGSPLGMGHVVRCVNIAGELKALGSQAHFIVNDERPVIERVMAAGFGFSLARLGDIKAVEGFADAVVIDSKKDILKILSALKGRGVKTIAIDNPEAARAADAVIIPSVNLAGSRRSLNVRSGRDYIIIGRSFIESMEGMKAAQYGLPLRVLVTMGGADPNHLTEKVLNALNGVEGIETTVVIGPAFKSKACFAGERLKVISNVSDMAPLMRGCHLAFSAVGTTVYEMAYMGVPSVLISNYREDADDLKGFESHGISVSLGFHEEVSTEDIRRAVRRFLEDGLMLRKMSVACRALTDGLGASRVAGIIMGLAKEKGGNENAFIGKGRC